MCNEQRAALHPSWMFYGSFFFFRCSCFVCSSSMSYPMVVNPPLYCCSLDLSPFHHRRVLMANDCR